MGEVHAHPTAFFFHFWRYSAKTCRTQRPTASFGNGARPLYQSASYNMEGGATPLGIEQYERSDAMDQGPLVTEQIDAGARFLVEFQNQYPVLAAFWLRDSDYGNWNLYIASEEITDDNFDVAYGEVVRIACEMKDPWFDLFQVKVLGADAALTKAAVELQRRYPGRSPARLGSGTFGGGAVDEVYVYPSPLQVAVP